MSNIVSTTIDESFPEEGKDNPSQGFRDNFSIIKAGLATAASEIAELQSKSVLKTPLSGGSVNNNLDGNLIFNARTRSVYSVVNVVTPTPSVTNIDVTFAEYQRFPVNSSQSINFINWPADAYAKVRLELVRSDANDGLSYTVSFTTQTVPGGLPGVIPIGDATSSSISTGILPSTSVIVEVWSANGGQTVYLSLVGDSDAGSALATIDQIGDVAVSDPAPGQVLKFNGTQWINDSDNDTIITSLASIPGTDIDNPLNGQVLRFDGINWTNGSVIGDLSINDLSNVVLNSPSSGQVLKFNGTQWVNDNDNDTLVTSLSSIPGVVIDNPTTGQVLKWNGTNWINDTDSIGDNLGLGDLNNVNTSGATANQVLKFNGTQWVSGTVAGDIELTDLSNVTITGATNGQVLKFNGTQWVNAADSLGDDLSLGQLNNVTINSPVLGQVLKFNGSGWVNGTDDTLYFTGAEDIPSGVVIDLTKSVTFFTTVTSETATLPTATQGSIKTLIMTGFGGDMVVTAANAGWGGAGTITFTAAGQACTMQYINNAWYCIGNNGVTFA
jgi:hypothetical protein